jgi:hypothetical protein
VGLFGDLFGGGGPRARPGLGATEAYRSGYRDGYAGTWVAPVRWLFSDDYRHGRQDGAADRDRQLPSKYPTT